MFLEMDDCAETFSYTLEEYITPPGKRHENMNYTTKRPVTKTALMSCLILCSTTAFSQMEKNKNNESPQLYMAQKMEQPPKKKEAYTDSTGLEKVNKLSDTFNAPAKDLREFKKIISEIQKNVDAEIFIPEVYLTFKKLKKDVKDIPIGFSIRFLNDNGNKGIVINLIEDLYTINPDGLQEKRLYDSGTEIYFDKTGLKIIVPKHEKKEKEKDITEG
jgi:hypothetical protein